MDRPLVGLLFWEVLVQEGAGHLPDDRPKGSAPTEAEAVGARWAPPKKPATPNRSHSPGRGRFMFGVTRSPAVRESRRSPGPPRPHRIYRRGVFVPTGRPLVPARPSSTGPGVSGPPEYRPGPQYCRYPKARTDSGAGSITSMTSVRHTSTCVEPMPYQPWPPRTIASRGSSFTHHSNRARYSSRMP